MLFRSMNRNPMVVISQDASAEEAASLMLTKKVHRLFAIDDDSTICGVLSNFDIMSVLAGLGTLEEISDMSGTCCLCGSTLNSTDNSPSNKLFQVS